MTLMTPNDYQKLAFRTSPCPDSSVRAEMHGVFGLCSEAGEVAALYQKEDQGRNDRRRADCQRGDHLAFFGSPLHIIDPQRVGRRRKLHVHDIAGNKGKIGSR